MNKFVAFCIAMLIQPFLVKGSMASQGLPSSFYQTNPMYRMSIAQKATVKNAFIWAQNAFQRNHSVCRNRDECLSLDLQTLRNYINNYPKSTANIFFKDIYNIIYHDALRQKFTTQWVIYQQLSPARQADFRNGLRITPVQSRNVMGPNGTITPAFYNQDDVFTDLLQEVDHHHKNCDQYITCLRGDLTIIDNIDRRVNVNDPIRYSLRNLKAIITTEARVKIFDTSLYLNLYNPFSPNWYDMTKRHKAKKLSSYGYQQWKQIERSSRAVTWLNPRFTNGAPQSYSPGSPVYQQPQPQYQPQPQPAQSGSFRSYVEGIRGKTQNETGKVKSWKQHVTEYVLDNKDLLKGWW
jgi:hypothetical protein